MEEMNMNTDEERKVNEAFAEGSENFTEARLIEVLKDSDTAHEKAGKHLGKFFEEFKLLWQLLCDYKSGEYSNVPWKFIAAVGFAVFYLINPFDVIPDVIPVVGYLDDASVFGLVLAAFKSDIEAYKTWKNGQASTVKMQEPLPVIPESDKNYNPYRLPADYPAPREILNVHFPKKANQLCFSGGWGYDQKTATIVKQFDPEVNPTEHFDGVSLEYVFIQKRIWEELEFARPEGERFFGMEENTAKQSVVMKNGIPYDVIEVAVTAYPEKDWNELKDDWESHNGYADDPVGKKKHKEWNQRCQISFTEEFWFDIRDFY